MDAADPPKVTAVIPAYNMERYIARALLSAVKQTYQHLDILVIDDGSTDATAEIARGIALEHPNVRVVSTANAGVAAARNLGTEMAQSLYVAYFDADDVWHPLKIEKQVAALAVHGHRREWGACYSLYRLIDPLDQVLDNGASSRERGDFFNEHLVWNPIGNGSNLLVRRDLALEVGGFSPEYAAAGIGGCEDLEFQLRLLCRTKVEVVREFLLGYRFHPAQMSGDIVRMRLSQIAVIEKIIAESEPATRTRNRALVQAYLTAAKGFFLMRDWRPAFKWVLACLAVSPIETARKIDLLCRHELGYWTLRLRLMLRAPARRSEPLRPFDDFLPSEGVDVSPRDRVRYRSTLVGGAPARATRRQSAATQARPNDK